MDERIKKRLWTRQTKQDEKKRHIFVSSCRFLKFTKNLELEIETIFIETIFIDDLLEKKLRGAYNIRMYPLTNLR